MEARRDNSQGRMERNHPRVRARRNGARGVALVVTLVLLTLLSAIAVAVFLSVSSDTMINGYYRNYRGSFYAADSGINVVVQAMENTILATAVDNSTTGAAPLSVGGAVMPAQASQWTPAGKTAASFLNAAYSPYQNSYYKVGDTGSWNGQFELVAITLGTVQFQVAPADGNSCWPATPTCPNNKNKTNDYNFTWVYAYPYTVTVSGQSSGSESETITETGTINYTSTSGSPGTGNPPSFSRWAGFITNFAACPKGPLVPGYMTGPFFTDGQWAFGNPSKTSTGYIFTGTVGQVSTTTSWFPSNGTCDNQATAPKGMNLPTFQQGFQTGQTKIVPPSNSYNQEQAVLDGKGTPPCTSTPCADDPPPDPKQMSQELKTVGGTSYSSSGTTGVYIPYYTNAQNQNVYGSDPNNGGDGAGGGFLVNGDASITLSATTAGTGTTKHTTQTYAITQGSTTTTIVVDNANGTTTVSSSLSGTQPLVLQGVPEQLDPNTSAPIIQTDPSGSVVNPTMIYVNGHITRLSGTVQNDTGINITASTDVSITGDLTYATAPVSIPSDVLISSTNAGVLGIYTTGNINLYPNSSGSNANNLTVDASLAAIGNSNGTAGFETPGNKITTWTILGGRSEDQAHNVSITSGNTYYDLRFANNFGPPWFPTGVPQAGSGSQAPSQNVYATRTSWQEIR